MVGSISSLFTKLPAQSYDLLIGHKLAESILKELVILRLDIAAF